MTYKANMADNANRGKADMPPVPYMPYAAGNPPRDTTYGAYKSYKTYGKSAHGKSVHGKSPRQTMDDQASKQPTASKQTIHNI